MPRVAANTEIIEIFSTPQAKTEIIPGLNGPDTWFLPLPEIRRTLPEWSRESATGELTVVDHQRRTPAPAPAPTPTSASRTSYFAPWGDVLGDMRRDSKSLIYMLLILALGAAAYFAVAHSVPSAGNTVLIKPQTTQATPETRHRRTQSPSQAPTHPSVPVQPVRPSEARTYAPRHASPDPAPKPTHTQTMDPSPMPTPTHHHEAPPPPHTTKPTPKPTHTATPEPTPTHTKPTPTTQPTHTPKPDPEPTRQPEPTHEPEPEPSRTVVETQQAKDPQPEPSGTP